MKESIKIFYISIIEIKIHNKREGLGVLEFLLEYVEVKDEKIQSSIV